MGCGSSAPNFEEEKVDHEDLKTNLPETTKKEIQSYDETHKRIENIVFDINSKFKDDFYNFLDGLVTEETFFKRYEALLTKNKITKSDIHTYGFELDILRKLQRTTYKDYDVHSFILAKQMESHSHLSEKKLAEFKALLDQNIKVFPKLQRGLIFEVNDDDVSATNTARILKYNQNFTRTEIINFQISYPMRNTDIMKDVAEVIKLNFHLITVVISVSFDNSYKSDDPNSVKFFDGLIQFIENIKLHKFIKAFALIFDFPDDKKITLPLSFYNSLNGFIKTKYLLSLVLVNIPFSDELGKKFCASIGFNETIKFLLICFLEPIVNFVEDLSTSMNKMKGLLALSIIGGNLEAAKAEELVMQMKKIKIIDYKKEL
jgi:hypothetical protein